MGVFRLSKGVAKVGDVRFDAGKLFAADGLSPLRVARATFDPTANTAQRPKAAYPIGPVIPNKAIIVGGLVQVNTIFTTANADAGLIALHVQGANDLISAIAVSNGTPWDAGMHDITPDLSTPAGGAIALTADRMITATVTGEVLLGGKMTIFLFYLPGS